MMGKSDVLKITMCDHHVCQGIFNEADQVQVAEAVMVRGGRQVSPSWLSAWRPDQRQWRPLLGGRY